MLDKIIGITSFELLYAVFRLINHEALETDVTYFNKTIRIPKKKKKNMNLTRSQSHLLILIRRSKKRVIEATYLRNKPHMTSQ